MDAGTQPKQFFKESVTPQSAWFLSLARLTNTSVASYAWFITYSGYMYAVPGNLKRAYFLLLPSPLVFSNSTPAAADWSAPTFQRESRITTSSGPAVAQALSTRRMRFAPARPSRWTVAPTTLGCTQCVSPSARP